MRTAPSDAKPRSWLTYCAGECFWTCVAAAVAIGLLTVFVLVFEARLDISAMREAILAPVNVVRLVVLTACLALWSYIVRVISTAPTREDRPSGVEHAVHAGSTHAH
ncbi:hypothetical protein [Lysobacter sp. A3-1-A15]|uniref:hypothetical protein n=1 Tax=Novilysobacter viscosus TaxID=3098602 RepID=UPI002ED93DC3